MNKAIAAIASFLAAAVSLALLGSLTPAEAQKRYVQLEGTVQFIAGQKLSLIPDIGTSIDIDIAKVPLEDYRTLTQGDRVVVGGVVSSDNRKVYGEWVKRDTRWGSQFQ